MGELSIRVLMSIITNPKQEVNLLVRRVDLNLGLEFQRGVVRIFHEDFRRLGFILFDRIRSAESL